MRQRGITLIELMVTLTILGLILAVAIPGFGSWLRNTQVRNAAESLQNGIQKARNEALRRNQNVTFWLVSTDTTIPGRLIATCALSAASASWVVSIDDPSGKCTNDPSDSTAPRLIEAHGQADGAPMVLSSALQSDNTTAATSITFNGFGRPVGTSGISRIDLDYSDARKLRIVVSSGGGLRLCDREVTSTTDPRKCPA